MKDLCMISYITINHKMLNAFIEIWHINTLSFHLSLSEMSITLDDVFSLLYLLIRGKLLDHGRISKDGALEMMVNYSGVDPEDVMGEFAKTRGCHARFEYLKKIFTYLDPWS